MPTILWFRSDLRLSDNAALRFALDRDAPVIPVFIWAPEEEGTWSPGGASRWWLHQSLADLSARLESRGSRLLLRKGETGCVLERLARDTGADQVLWNRLYGPAAMARDEAIADRMRSAGIRSGGFPGALLWEPGSVMTGSGGPYKVFTPFWKACLESDPPGAPLREPRRIPAPKRWPSSEALDSLGLEPEIDWAGGLRTTWSPGERGARRQLRRFLEEAVASYVDRRDRPDIDATSRLSPHLHFGEISARTVWHAVRSAAGGRPVNRLAKGPAGYLRQLVWREFSHHLLVHFPRTPDEPLRSEFADFPWRRDARALRAWQRGRTGYPIVDAGMRQLWTTGWMHNRVRMIVASFLVKDLLIPWQEGASWFWDTLVDADLANNTMGWQWTAGCGADAAPYFRIFNPVMQGERYDPQGAYVRTWVPELADLPAKWIHRPWQAPEDALRKADVVPGESYPEPIVDHGVARNRALEALATITKDD